MDDLTLTRKCAEAMGLDVGAEGMLTLYKDGMVCGQQTYNPLKDDAQCFALVKAFGMVIEPDPKRSGMWGVTLFPPRDHGKKVSTIVVRHAENLNRAIVEAVASMQGHPEGIERGPR